MKFQNIINQENKGQWRFKTFIKTKQNKTWFPSGVMRKVLKQTERKKSQVPSSAITHDSMLKVKLN